MAPPSALAAARRSVGAQAGVCAVAGRAMQKATRAEMATPISRVQWCSMGASLAVVCAVIGRIVDCSERGERGDVAFAVCSVLRTPQWWVTLLCPPLAAVASGARADPR